MSFSNITRPRKEVLRATGVSSIVDLQNLREGKGLEARPEDFLELTYPTSDIRYVIQNLHERFASGKQTAGLYLFEGFKGSGKSHLLLFLHHLLSSPETARSWLRRHGLECSLPDRPVIVTHKFTDFPMVGVWELLLTECGASGNRSDAPPNLDEFRQAIAGKHVFLILDELERGIRSIADEARQIQNLNFLQMITEEAYRTADATITVFAGIYDAAREPGATLKRVPRIDVKFSEPEPVGVDSPGRAQSGGTTKTGETDTVAAEPLDLETSFVRGIGNLRQQVAQQLAQHEAAIVREIVLRIYFEKKNTDFGLLPTGLRGSLSSLGDITVDLTISKRGTFSKADVEQLVESLPSFAEGNYKAEIKAELPHEAR